MTNTDRTILRDLATRYMEVCVKPEINQARPDPGSGASGAKSVFFSIRVHLLGLGHGRKKTPI